MPLTKVENSQYSNHLKESQDSRELQPEKLLAESQTANALKGAEKDITTANAKKESSKMAYALENQKFEQLPLTSYTEIVQNTPLHQKILNVVAMPEFNDDPEFKGKTPEQRAEYLFRKINSGILHFYARKLDIPVAEPVPEYLYKVILPATEWTLMNMLKYNKHENNVNFLSELTNFSMNSIPTMFSGVTSLAKKFTYPYEQTKKLMNVSDFIALPKNRHLLKNLKNPYDFYEKVMQNPIWSKDKLDINTISFSQFNLADLSGQELSQAEIDQKLASQKEKIQKEIGSIQMVESPETVKKLLGVLKKSDTFFEQTDALSNSLLDTLDKYNSVDATLKSTFGVDIFDAVKSSKFLSGILNFVLSLLGFSGGVAGLERSWKKRKIDKEMTAPRKKLITESYEEYEKDKKTDENTANSVLKAYGLEKLPEDQKSKFNLDLPKIEEIIDQKFLSGDGTQQINLFSLLAIKTDRFDGKDFLDEIKTPSGAIDYKIKPELFSNPTNKELFLQAYMTIMLTGFASNQDFLKQAEDADSLAFCLFSGLVIQKDNVIDGIKAEALLPAAFYQKLEIQPENPDTLPAQSESNEGKVQSNQISDTFESSERELVDTLINLIIQGEARENYDAVNPNDINGVSIGLMQWHKVRAGNLLKRLKAKNQKLFESIMTDPIFADLTYAGNSAWNPDQVAQFKTLMKKSEFQEVMKDQVREDISGYIDNIRSRGITDPRAILTMGRIYNAGSQFAKNLKDTMIKNGGDINDYTQIIAAYNASSHGKYKIFDQKSKTGETYAQLIQNYKVDNSTAIV